MNRVLVETLTVAQQAFYVTRRLHTLFTIEPSSETDEFSACLHIHFLKFYFNIMFFLLIDFPASECYMPTFRNTLFHSLRHISFRRRGITQKKECTTFRTTLILFFLLRLVFNVVFLSSNSQFFFYSYLAWYKRRLSHLPLFDEHYGPNMLFVAANDLDLSGLFTATH